MFLKLNASTKMVVQDEDGRPAGDWLVAQVLPSSNWSSNVVFVVALKSRRLIP
jgi:hypothetical protein